ncbi:hypothetical protein [Paenibacillus bovis]|uniref:Pesticidal crystal protein Cry22Aa Ig-like domain-containing protein n=1 Tax=Paenibacillus bovis TaxID=1616788 RepID=A0A172ZH48_9BACL|nr:hypothetical protein [Paenibacillus bovis]ANF96470.1 hypothetical protein AR543_10960 [Paenibacillus bovis]
MKKGLLWGLVICLILTGVVNSRTFAANSIPEEAVTGMVQENAIADNPSKSTVHNEVYTLPEQPAVSTLQNEQSSVQQDVYDQLQNFAIATPNGMSYYNGYIYVAQGQNGLSRISLTTGKIHVVVGKSSQIAFRSVTVDTYGSLYYSLRSKPYVYKFTFNKSVALPLTADKFVSQSTIYTEVPLPSDKSERTEISGLAMGPDNQLYISLFHKYYNNFGPELTGLLKWDNPKQKFYRVIENQSMSIKAIAFDPQGNLHVQLAGYYEYESPYVMDELNRIPGSALKNLPISKKTPKPYFHEALHIYGLVILPNGRVYVADSQSIFAPFPGSKPRIILKNAAPIQLFQNEPYVERGAIVEDEKYSDLPLQLTYTLDGQPVSRLDTSLAGEYKVYYNAINADGLVAETQTQTVTVKPLPNDLSEIDLRNPKTMDAANGNLYVANGPIYDQSQPPGIYKFSLSDYKRSVLVDTNQLFNALAVDTAGNLYFVLPDSKQIGKVDARYLSTSVPLTLEQFLSHAEYFMPFTEKQVWEDGRITGLDFDKYGKLYIALSRGENYGRDSILARTDAKDLKVTEPVVSIPYTIKDISFGPSGNLLFMESYIHRITASQLLDFQPNLRSEKLSDNYPTFFGDGIAILPNGEVYTSNRSIDSTYVFTNIQKTPFIEPALPDGIEEDNDRLENLNITNPWGVEYHDGYVYFAQGMKGLSKVSLATRQITPIVTGPNTSFHSVALDSSGNLYYTTDFYNQDKASVKKIAAADIPTRPITAAELSRISTDYAIFSSEGFYNVPSLNIAISPKDELYISTDVPIKAGRTIFKWNESSKQWIPLLADNEPTSRIAFDTKGNLYFMTYNRNDWNPMFTKGINKVTADSLNGTWPITADKVNIYKHSDSQTNGAQDFLFLPDGKSYTIDGTSIQRIFPASRPVIVIDKEEVSQFQDDLYYERGFIVDHDTYSDFKKTITYSFQGKIIPKIDVHTPGIYTVHYNAVTPGGISALEKVRFVRVKPLPSFLSDWDVDAIKGMGSNDKDLYLTSEASEQNPNYGLLRISTSTLLKTKIADLPNGKAVTVNDHGDIFFSRSGYENMFYKLDARYVKEETVLSHNELMGYSQTFKPFTDAEVKGYSVQITGLDWDKRGNLYVAASFTNKKTHVTTGKVVRLKGTYFQSSILVAEFPAATYDIEFSRNGNLYVIADEFKIYKAAAAQLNTLPLTPQKFTTIDNSNGDEAISFLADGYGYVSSMNFKESYDSSLIRLPVKD